MIKEEIFARLDQLMIDQLKYNKFMDYTRTFTNDIRCKKGCLEFAKDVFNLPQLAGLDELAMRLVSSKSSSNSTKTLYFITNHPIALGYNEALVAARVELMGMIAQYVLEMADRIAASEWEDKHERQVYLRRAVARLQTLFCGDNKIPVAASDWHLVEPASYVNYLGETLAELVDRFSNGDKIKKYADSWGDYNQLNCETTLQSLRNFLDYLDSYLKF